MKICLVARKYLIKYLIIVGFVSILSCATNINKNGWTVLMMAAWRGDSKAVQALLDKGADVNEKNKHGWTVLMMAAWRGDSKTVQALLDKGADVNEKDIYGTTALMMAAENGHTETVQVLLDKGAEENAKRNNNKDCDN